MASKKRLIEHISREEVCRLCHNKKEHCGKEKCPVYKAPTVDAVEVVHGRWEEWWPGIALIMTGEEMLYRCSACDAKYPDVEGYKYCPHCGAKMDGERNDNGNL